MEVRIWEGRRCARRMTKRGRRCFRRPRTAFGRAKRTLTFAGEELVSFYQHRGECRIFRTNTGEIVVHRVRWSPRTSADDQGVVFRFKNLDAVMTRSPLLRFFLFVTREARVAETEQ